MHLSRSANGIFAGTLTNGGPSNDEMQGLYRTPQVPQRLAVARISYAAKVWSVGPSTLRELLPKESSISKTSWWHYLCADLEWCRSLTADAFPVEELVPEALALSWFKSPAFWKTLARTALRKGALQEAAAADARSWHRKILAVLHQHGATTSGLDDPAIMSKQYPCECGKAFTTPQGLAAHRRFAHGYVAPETLLVKDLTQCPACLKHLWTPARLKQHLSYIPRKGGPNPCYQKLIYGGFQVEDASREDEEDKKKIFMASSGINRRDALQAMGPLPALENIALTTYREAEARYAGAKQRFEDKFNFDNVGRDSCGSLWQQLDEATHHWFSTWDYDQDEDEAKSRLQDAWLTTHFENDLVLSATILPWGRDSLPEITAQWMTGVAERLAEEVFADFVLLSDSYIEEQAVERLAGRVRQAYEELHNRMKSGHTDQSGKDRLRDGEATKLLCPCSPR